MLNNSFMDALAGVTYAKQFAFSTGGPGTVPEPFGGVGWGAEFGIIDPDQNNLQLALATVANSKAGWAGPGVLWIAFPQTETYDWTWTRASWYLDLVAPNTTIDPNGYRQNVLRGTMMCAPRAPSRLEATYQIPNFCQPQRGWWGNY